MRILLVDDDKNSRSAVGWFLRDEGHEVIECDNAGKALELWKNGDYPLVLSDIKMPDMTGIDLVRAISGEPESWRSDAVLFTGYGDMNSAIEALRAGAYDYLLKPVGAPDLAAVIKRVTEHQALLRENKQLTENFEAKVKAATAETEHELKQMRRMVAETVLGKVGIFSEEMNALIDLAHRYHRDKSIPVLIQGETGTGKEVIARIIHYGDKVTSESGPLIDLNCAAIPASLFESELFGYESGSFTGSLSRGQKGKLDAAAGGTLFLDEIAEMPVDMQAKLLRVIETKEYYRVGGLKKIKADIRIICATNVDLDKRMAEGAFRPDLYYRLKVGHLTVPALRERRQDIVPLAAMFLQDFAQKKGKRFTEISADAARLLENYDWPGNVRELKNIIEWIVFMFDNHELTTQHLAKLVRVNPIEEAGHQASDAEAAYFQIPFPSSGFSLKDYTDLIIRKVLAAHDGNQSATARYLDITLRALCYRLENMRKKALQI